MELHGSFKNNLNQPKNEVDMNNRIKYKVFKFDQNQTNAITVYNNIFMFADFIPDRPAKNLERN
jgi:hypothetical protein